MFIVTLHAARVNKNLTLKDVAKKTGRHPETIAKYENDSTSIPRDLMVQLTELYEIPAEYIFFGRESVFTGSEQKKRVG